MSPADPNSLPCPDGFQNLSRCSRDLLYREDIRLLFVVVFEEKDAVMKSKSILCSKQETSSGSLLADSGFYTSVPREIVAYKLIAVEIIQITFR